MSKVVQRYANSVQRVHVYNADSGNCHYCGIALNLKGFHVDHKVPFSKGGATELDNLVASCYMCNGAKHTMNYFKFKYNLSAYGIGWRRRRYFAIKASFSKA
jgi:5-methylcytosine-specific restriction endonuclease McrA